MKAWRPRRSATPPEGSGAPRADFIIVIVEGDPVADIAMAADRANHRAVFKDGKPAKGLPRRAGGLGAPQAAAAASAF